MLQYLNKYMSGHKEWNHELAAKFEEHFTRVCKLVNTTLEKPFRPKRVVNAAILEAVMIALMENPEIDDGKLKSQYPTLIADEDFQDRITGATTDTAVLRSRIEKAVEILRG